MRYLGFLFLLMYSHMAIADVVVPPVSIKVDAESALLNLPLSLQLKKLLIWDESANMWRVPKPEEGPSVQAPVMVLHLWADYCKPCVREFPIVRDFAQQTEITYAGKVEFLYVSMTSSPNDMRAFLLKHRDILPKAAQYSAVSLQEELEHHLPNTLSLPATFVLDARRRIRATVLGSLIHRRVELGRMIARLVASPEQPSSSP
jgi:thiol-disulfide isomerase/thioredoxin